MCPNLKNNNNEHLSVDHRTPAVIVGRACVIRASSCVVYSFSSPEAALLSVSTKNRDRSRFLVLTKRSAASGDENVVYSAIL